MSYGLSWLCSQARGALGWRKVAGLLGIGAGSVNRRTGLGGGWHHVVARMSEAISGLLAVDPNLAPHVASLMRATG